MISRYTIVILKTLQYKSERSMYRVKNIIKKVVLIKTVNILHITFMVKNHWVLLSHGVTACAQLVVTLQGTHARKTKARCSNCDI